MATAKTLGVLRYNDEIRKETMNRSRGVYSLMDNVNSLNPLNGVQRIFEPILKNGTIEPLTKDSVNNKDLLSITHDNSSKYSEYINNRYSNVTDDMEYYEYAEPVLDEINVWFGKYENYLDYISYVYGNEYTTLKFANEVLSDFTFDSGNLFNSVGAVSDINVFINYEDNPNGIKNDTRLGKIARQIVGFEEERKGFNGNNKYIIDDYLLSNFQNKETKHNDTFENNELNYNYTKETDVHFTYKDETQGKLLGGTNSSILYKTQELFNRGKIDTLINRFYLSKSKNEGELYTNDELITGGKIKTYGYGRGKMLLTADASLEKEDPFCRAWTQNHRYERLKDAIRPSENFTLSEMQNASIKYRSKFFDKELEMGSDYLIKNSVLQRNGLVRITPTDNSSGKDIKNVMLSIENLAWKDVLFNNPFNIDKEQQGPNNGRIMWFPPYDLDFQENVSVNWNESSFIGRGESVYTYTNTKRTGSLSFSLLIDHPSLLNSLVKNKSEKNTYGSQTENSDILRFFNGCDYNGGGDDGGKDDAAITVSPDIPKEIPDEKGKSIVFYIYFPNNYSGKNDDSSKSGYLNYEDLQCDYTNDTPIHFSPCMPDWYVYLLCGKGVYIHGNGEMIKKFLEDKGNIGLGYEMNGCISNELKDNFTSYAINSLGDIYHYRADVKRIEQHFEIMSNYSDSGNFHLNSSIENGNDDADYSFSEIISTLIETNKMWSIENLYGDVEGETSSMGTLYTDYVKGTNTLTMSPGYITEGEYNEKIEKLKEIIEKIYSDSNYKIKITSCATRQNIEDSNSLSNDRKNTVRNFLKDIGLDRFDDEAVDVDGPTDKDINSLSAKKNRNVRVEIIYDLPEVDKAINGEKVNVEEERDKNNFEVEKNKIISNLLSDSTLSTRYKNEYEFFKDLEQDSPILYEQLINKFHYFNPAFHSMTPEGFNARLTFLHQCTRQGHTMSNSEATTYTTGAGNLAFGRMPVCVLRIGDFINTRILIESMTISYSETNWDLNPEGIGVQPMFAKITLNVIILGGQSLEAPISRLQNALSFNYYANAGVYDDRADRASYANDGIIDYKYIFIPNMKETEAPKTKIEPNTTLNDENNEEGSKTDEYAEKVNNYDEETTDVPLTEDLAEEMQKEYDLVIDELYEQDFYDKIDKLCADIGTKDWTNAYDFVKSVIINCESRLSGLSEQYGTNFDMYEIKGEEELVTVKKGVYDTFFRCLSNEVYNNRGIVDDQDKAKMIIDVLKTDSWDKGLEAQYERQAGEIIDFLQKRVII